MQSDSGGACRAGDVLDVNDNLQSYRTSFYITSAKMHIQAHEGPVEQ